MVQHIWTVLCSQGVVDKQTNNLSLHNVIEEINISAPELSRQRPVLIALGLSVISLWSRTDDEPCRGRARLRFFSPAGERLAPHEYNVDLRTHSRSRTIAMINGLKVQEAGRHYFQVELLNEGEIEWHVVVEIPLQIVHTPTPPAQAPNPVE